MYSESDIDAAVTAGAIDAAAAARLRDFVAANRAAPAVDEESFRLITGFNDIFVTIAALLLLVAVGWIGGEIAAPLAGFGVAAVAWGLAEYFTRTRRMALPSILLLLAFAGGLFAGGMALFFDGRTSMAMAGNLEDGRVRTLAFGLVAAGAVAAGGTWLHWRRFRVPITVATGAGAAVALAIGLILTALPAAADHVRPLTFAAGLIVFALAMRWDMSDPERTTRRSDVAFWLHLLAAPMIVHPVFTALGLLGRDASSGAAGIVLLLYVALGCMALAIDRRALMVSALVYVLFAVSAVFRQFSVVGLNVAFTALVIGSALLLLSAFWQVARAFVVGLLPDGVARRLPPVRKVIPRPAS
jgi:hypothetical protein